MTWLGGVVVLAAAALIAAAVIPGSHAGARKPAVALKTVSHEPAQAPFKPSITKVYDSNISAKKYGTLIASMENGVNQEGQMVPDLSPEPARLFKPAFRQYRRYAEGWADTLSADMGTLTATLRAGNRVKARSEWETAFADYLHLGATYGLLPDGISHQIDALPPYTGQKDFPGLHRLEMGLWTRESLRTLVPVATRLSSAVHRLHHVLATTPLDPLDYVARGHEVLEDAQRDFLSGAQVPWSHEGVLATAAGVAATREIVHTLTPLLRGRDNTLGTSQYWIARMSAELRKLRRPNGTYPTLDQLNSQQRLDLNGVVAGGLSQLQMLPSTLETVKPPVFPKIPSQK